MLPHCILLITICILSITNCLLAAKQLQSGRIFPYAQGASSTADVDAFVTMESPMDDSTLYTTWLPYKVDLDNTKMHLVKLFYYLHWEQSRATCDCNDTLQGAHCHRQDALLWQHKLTIWSLPMTMCSLCGVCTLLIMPLLLHLTPGGGISPQVLRPTCVGRGITASGDHLLTKNITQNFHHACSVHST